MRSLFILSTLFLISLGMAASAQPVPTPVPVAAPAPTGAQLAEAEKLTQQIRAEQRRIDFDNSGLTWLPWSQTGKSTRDFVAKREPNLKFILSNNRHLDVAVYDFDHNNEPDIILYFWGDCGNQGCMYRVYFNGVTKQPRTFFGNELVPYKKGIMLDHGYFVL